jgi:GT2 family glycosyltransferase
MQTPTVSIVIVNYNTRGLTLACLASIKTQTQYVSYQLLVVDNGSMDGSVEAIRAQHPDVELLEAERNLGFAAANNWAAEHASGDYLLLLNSDTVVLGRAIDRLVHAAQTWPKAGIWGGRTVFPDGSANPTHCWRRPRPWSLFCYGTGLGALFRHWSLFHAEAYRRDYFDRPRNVDIVSGCFLLIRRGFWMQLGGLDPAFFMYGEEADLCLRARRLGARPQVCPEATIVHYGGASNTQSAVKLVQLFYAKHQLMARFWQQRWLRFGRGCLRMWAGTRVGAWQMLHAITGRYDDRLATWRTVWQRRAEWLTLESTRGTARPSDPGRGETEPHIEGALTRP